LLNVSAVFGQQLSDGTISLDSLESINDLFKFQTVKLMLARLEQTLRKNIDWA
jgi:GGDEF domain-containing protein